MIVELFTWLSQALASSPEIAIGAAFVWGVLSVILSPCHIACIPLIVGFIDGQGNISTGRAFGLSSLFGLGILITIGIIGLITGLAGRMMGDIGGYGNYFVAVIFFAIGLNLLGIYRFLLWKAERIRILKEKDFWRLSFWGFCSALPWDPVHLLTWPRYWVLFSAWLPPKLFLPFLFFWLTVLDTARFLFLPALSRKSFSTTSTGPKNRKARLF